MVIGHLHGNATSVRVIQRPQRRRGKRFCPVAGIAFGQDGDLSAAGLSRRCISYSRFPRVARARSRKSLDLIRAGHRLAARLKVPRAAHCCNHSSGPRERRALPMLGKYLFSGGQRAAEMRYILAHG
jgi:hypothetical protein